MPTENRSLLVFLLIVVAIFVAYAAARYVQHRRRVSAQRPRPSALTQYLPLEMLAGAITAHEAVTAVTPQVARYGGARCLMFLSAGEGMDDHGRSERWEMWFELPELGKLAVCQVEPGEPAVGGAKSPLYLNLRVRPADPGSKLTRLPERFVDSPDAARALAAQGVDFVAGDIHTLVQVKPDASGRPVWHAAAYGKEYTTPFER